MVQLLLTFHYGHIGDSSNFYPLFDGLYIFFEKPVLIVKELSLCHELKSSIPYILGT